jgi:hypothetical protein
VIDDNFDVEKAEEQKKLLEQIKTDIAGLFTATFVYNTKKNQYGTVTWSDSSATVGLFVNTSVAFMNTLDKIAAKVPDEQKKEYIITNWHLTWLIM